MRKFPCTRASFHTTHVLIANRKVWRKVDADFSQKNCYCKFEASALLRSGYDWFIKHAPSRAFSTTAWEICLKAYSTRQSSICFSKVFIPDCIYNVCQLRTGEVLFFSITTQQAKQSSIHPRITSSQSKSNHHLPKCLHKPHQPCLQEHQSALPAQLLRRLDSKDSLTSSSQSKYHKHQFLSMAQLSTESHQSQRMLKGAKADGPLKCTASSRLPLVVRLSSSIRHLPQRRYPAAFDIWHWSNRALAFNIQHNGTGTAQLFKKNGQWYPHGQTHGSGTASYGTE